MCKTQRAILHQIHTDREGQKVGRTGRFLHMDLEQEGKQQFMNIVIDTKMSPVILYFQISYC